MVTLKFKSLGGYVTWQSWWPGLLWPRQKVTSDAKFIHGNCTIWLRCFHPLSSYRRKTTGPLSPGTKLPRQPGRRKITHSRNATSRLPLREPMWPNCVPNTWLKGPSRQFRVASVEWGAPRPVFFFAAAPAPFRHLWAAWIFFWQCKTNRTIRPVQK